MSMTIDVLASTAGHIVELIGVLARLLYGTGMRLIAGPYSMPQIDFNRIDHIDIVKGPASVLYGNLWQPKVP